MRSKYRTFCVNIFLIVISKSNYNFSFILKAQLFSILSKDRNVSRDVYIKCGLGITILKFVFPLNPCAVPLAFNKVGPWGASRHSKRLQLLLPPVSIGAGRGASLGL